MLADAGGHHARSSATTGPAFPSASRAVTTTAYRLPAGTRDDTSTVMTPFPGMGSDCGESVSSPSRMILTSTVVDEAPKFATPIVLLAPSEVEPEGKYHSRWGASAPSESAIPLRAISPSDAVPSKSCERSATTRPVRACTWIATARWRGTASSIGMVTRERRDTTNACNASGSCTPSSVTNGDVDDRVVAERVEEHEELLGTLQRRAAREIPVGRRAPRAWLGRDVAVGFELVRHDGLAADDFDDDTGFRRLDQVRDADARLCSRCKVNGAGTPEARRHRASP